VVGRDPEPLFLFVPPDLDLLERMALLEALGRAPGASGAPTR
jgi:hypothetical protein